MKIAFLFGSLNRGGTETLMLDVCRNLNNSDFEAIGIYRKKGVMEQDFLSTSVKFHYLPVEKNKIAYFVRLRKLLIAEKVTIVHAQQPLDAVLAKIAMSATKTKVILTVHGFDTTEKNKKNKLLDFILKRTNKNIYVSQFQKRYYTTKYHLNEKKQIVIYNGIDFKKIEPTANEKSSDLRNELHINRETLLFGMVGNFTAVRDPMTVCRFLKLLNQKQVDFLFVFVGKKVDNEPERFDECLDFCKKNDLNERVRFLGSRQDVPNILHQLDAFVYSSEQDTFGIAVVEALAAGISVFVNDWEVMKEITENGNLAILYKSKDEYDLLDKFMLFLQSKEKFQSKAEGVKNTVRKKYDINSYLIHLKEIYASL